MKGCAVLGLNLSYHQIPRVLLWQSSSPCTTLFPNITSTLQNPHLGHLWLHEPLELPHNGSKQAQHLSLTAGTTAAAAGINNKSQ
jgi:hypothetical protein